MNKKSKGSSISLIKAIASGDINAALAIKNKMKKVKPVYAAFIQHDDGGVHFTQTNSREKLTKEDAVKIATEEGYSGSIFIIRASKQQHQELIKSN